MQTIERLEPLRVAVDELRSRGPVALVPTMGALHDGHLALVREAGRHTASVVVSIFVNPMQFGPNEDLAAYPRQLAEDQRLLAAEGVAVLWAPDAAEVYPAGFVTNVSVGELGERLCGASRLGHFDGVATIVAKLFNQVRPDVAVFGEKDWQQLTVIRRMARDLDLVFPRDKAIIGLATARERDGLAMSSRNRYLSPADRAAAAALPEKMTEAVMRIEAGEDLRSTLAALEEALLGARFSSVDYVQLVDAQSLATLFALATRPARLMVAARIGGTRLIDNMPVEPRP